MMKNKWYKIKNQLITSVDKVSKHEPLYFQLHKISYELYLMFELNFSRLNELTLIGSTYLNLNFYYMNSLLAAGKISEHLLHEFQLYKLFVS